jgi:hypothetical protein
VQDQETIGDRDPGRKEVEVDGKVGNYLETSRHQCSRMSIRVLSIQKLSLSSDVLDIPNLDSC